MPMRATPELQETFSTAVRQVANSGPRTPSSPETTSSVSGLVHSPVDEAKGGKPVMIKAAHGVAM